MNRTGKVCLWILAISSVSLAQDPSKPQLRPGVAVQMAAAPHAVVIPDADKEDATVVALTSAGKMFVGARPATTADLAQLKAGTVYVKADARASYQSLVSALDALRGHSVVLLTQPTEKVSGKIVSPYGLAFARTAQ